MLAINDWQYLQSSTVIVQGSRMTKEREGAVDRPLASAKADPAMLTRTMTLITGGASLHEILDAIVHGVEGEHPGMFCSVLLLDESGQHLVHGAAPSLPAFYTQAIDGLSIGPSAGSCGTSVYTGRRVVVTDIQTDPLWAAIFAQVRLLPNTICTI